MLDRLDYSTRTLERLPLVEVAVVSDVFATGIARIERVDPVERFVLYSEQLSADGRERELVIVAKIVAPLGALFRAANPNAN